MILWLYCHSNRDNIHLFPTVELTINYESDDETYLSLTQLVGGCYRTRACACGMPLCAGNIAEHFFTGKLEDYELLFLAYVPTMSASEIEDLKGRQTNSDDGNIPLVINYKALRAANRLYLEKPEIRLRKYANVIPLDHDLLLRLCMEVTGKTESTAEEMRANVQEVYESQIPIYVKQMRPEYARIVQAHHSRWSYVRKPQQGISSCHI